MISEPLGSMYSGGFTFGWAYVYTITKNRYM